MSSTGPGVASRGANVFISRDFTRCENRVPVCTAVYPMAAWCAYGNGWMKPRLLDSSRCSSGNERAGGAHWRSPWDSERSRPRWTVIGDCNVKFPSRLALCHVAAVSILLARPIRTPNTTAKRPVCVAGYLLCALDQGGAHGRATPRNLYRDMTRNHQKPPVAVRKRERDVYLLYGSAFRNLPTIEALDQHHTPRASADSTLIALAQLTATRLQAARACVSLIDDTHQHFLAEATPTLSLRPKPEDAASALWLGNVSVPRSWSVCEEVLDLRTDAVLVINDLSQTERYAQREFVKSGPRWRFYAGVPLVSPRGTVVGVLSIWDGEPRPGPGLSGAEVTLLQDFAATIVTYLDTYTLREQYQRGEQFTRGLLSFSQGASALKPFKVFQDDASNGSGTPSAGTGGSAHSLRALSSMGSRTIQASASNEQSIGSLQNSILPLHSKDMFSRAANVMMASSNLDGVLILDASVAATGHRQFPGTNDDDAGSGESSTSFSSGSDTASTTSSRHEMQEAKSPKKCSVLGYALRGKRVHDGSEFGTLLERDLARLLKEWSTGRITNFTATGASVSSTDDTSSSASGAEESASDVKRKVSGRKFRSSAAVHTLLPNARSVAFVPFWDYVSHVPSLQTFFYSNCHKGALKMVRWVSVLEQ
jgi:hypothetical protein